MSEPIRILLSERASERLSEVGAGAFIVIGKASYPDDPKRWVLHLVPCSVKAANNAVEVAMGRKCARKLPAKPKTDGGGKLS